MEMSSTFIGYASLQEESHDRQDPVIHNNIWFSIMLTLQFFRISCWLWLSRALHFLRFTISLNSQKFIFRDTRACLFSSKRTAVLSFFLPSYLRYMVRPVVSVVVPSLLTRYGSRLTRYLLANISHLKVFSYAFALVDMVNHGRFLGRNRSHLRKVQKR